MSETPPEHIEKMDWRIQNMTWTLEPFTSPATGFVVPAGTSVVNVALFGYGKERLCAAIPNATALFLNLSHTFHEDARSLLNKCIADKGEFRELPYNEVFTFYERMMGSAVSACTALEAFVNENIPDTYTYLDSSDKRFCRSFNKEQIERQLSPDTKTGDVIPDALGVPFPKGGKLWSAFIKLRDLRGCLKSRLRVTDHRRVMPITSNTDKLYDTDLTDAAWALIGPMLPAARRGGRPRTTNIRAVLNAIFYLLRTGCQWRLLPGAPHPGRHLVDHHLTQP